MKLVVFVLFVSNLRLTWTECRWSTRDCTRETAGFYRLCDSCTEYFWCLKGWASLLLTCPYGTFWDETFDTCTWDQTLCNKVLTRSNCGTLPTVVHGVFADQGNQTAVLQCDEGYYVRANFVTPGSITCTDGQWENVNTTNLCTDI